MEISVGVSNRHVHLSSQDFNSLFGDVPFYSVKDLKQGGEFASNLTLTLKGEKGEISNVRVLGPLRSKTQVEISRTDSYILGVNPPIRMSGDLDGSAAITLINGEKSIHLNEGCIIAHRHIHVNNQEALLYNFTDKEIVQVKVAGDRGGILDNVMVKIKDSFNLEFHVDTDEANAMGLKNNDKVLIINKGVNNEDRN